jgi:predicted dehydrogenase
MDQRVRVGIIGAGRMGRRHIKNAADLSLPIAGVCDLSDEALAAAGNECGIRPEQQFRDAREFLSRERPECVVISTTAPSHCSLTELAATCGARYILCEKPMAVSLDECDAMVRATDSRGVKLAIDHQMRFTETVRTIHKIAHSEEFGGLSSVTLVTGNIGLSMNGTHYFDFFRWLTGEIPETVSAWFSEQTFPNPRGPQYEDRAGTIRLATVSGKRFYLEAGADQGQGIVGIYGGRYGQIILDELTGVMHLNWRNAEERGLPMTRYAAPSHRETRNIHEPEGPSANARVLQALLDGASIPTGAEGKLAVQALVAAYVSNENGHVPVRLDDPALPRDKKFKWA